MPCPYKKTPAQLQKCRFSCHSRESGNPEGVVMIAFLYCSVKGIANNFTKKIVVQESFKWLAKSKRSQQCIIAK